MSVGHLNTKTDRKRGSTGSGVLMVVEGWSVLPIPAMRASSAAHGPPAFTRKSHSISLTSDELEL